MPLEDILSQYSKKYQLGKLELDDEGICHFIVNRAVFIALEKPLDGKGFYHYTTIGTIPHTSEAELGLEALAGNLFGKETGKACLGYEPNTETLVLFEFFNDDTSFEKYDCQLKKFVKTAQYWVNKIEVLVDKPLSKASLQKHIQSLVNYENMRLFFA